MPPCPDVAVKLTDREDIEAVWPDVPVGPLADVVGQYAVAVIVGGWLCELARTRDVAASHIEPIALHPPVRNVCHDGTPYLPGTGFNIMRSQPTGRDQTCHHDQMATLFGDLSEPRPAAFLEPPDS